MVSWAQQYNPLLNSENHWYLTSCYFGCLQDYYYAVDDTIVNGLPHKILDGYHYISRTFLLREEVSQKKVFLTKISPNRIDEYLLYDFNLEEGDSFEMINPISPFVQNGGLYILDSIRSKLVFDTTSRKHFYFSPHPENTSSMESPVWVEGTGSLSMINAPGGTPDFLGAGRLQCHYKNDDVFYRFFFNDSICNVNFLNLPQTTTVKNTPQIIRYSDGIKVLYKNQLKNETIQVLHSNGQLLKQLPFPKSDMFYIPLLELPRGIYLLVFKSHDSPNEVFKFQF